MGTYIGKEVLGLEGTKIGEHCLINHLQNPSKITRPMSLCGASHEGPKGLTEIQSSNRFHHLLSYQKTGGSKILGKPKEILGIYFIIMALSAFCNKNITFYFL